MRAALSHLLESSGAHGDDPHDLDDDETIDDSIASWLLKWPLNFQGMQELPWGKLFFGYVLVMTTVAFTVACGYFVMCRSCGANSCDFIGAFYVAVVSLSSNGGVFGEDPVMLTWKTSCFPWRTLLIHCAWLTGVCFLAMASALTLKKASNHARMKQRLLFSKKAVIHHSAAAVKSAKHTASSINLNKDTATPWVLQLRLANARPAAPLNAVAVSLTAVMVTNEKAGDDGSNSPRHLTSTTSSANGDRCLVDVELMDLPFTVSEAAIDEPVLPTPLASSSAAGDESLFMGHKHPTACRLWNPVVITHRLDDPASPVRQIVERFTLAGSLVGGGSALAFGKDPIVAAMMAGLQFVVEVTAVDALTGSPVLSRKVYHAGNIQFDYRFDPVTLTTPRSSSGGLFDLGLDLGGKKSGSRTSHSERPREQALRRITHNINWDAFSEVQPCDDEQ